MTNDKDLQKAYELISSAKWRLNNLYYIVDKQGYKIPFKLNWAQQQLYDNFWYCNIVLKARQLGMSTFASILYLDRALFNSNVSAGIIAHTREDSEALFKRVKFAYDNLPDEIRALKLADNDTANMLQFNNGSSIRVGTSLRSSTFQYLHISEFGKICAKYPDKAEEIITGSLNTVAEGQFIMIESTAEGRSGYFYDMCKVAQAKAGKELSKLDFKFHFFPWWGDPSYATTSIVPHSQEMIDYFDHLKSCDINLSNEQKNWYILKLETQQDNMMREYPSLPEESWAQSNEGLYYGKLITNVRIEQRITRIPYDDKLPVHTAWDLGYNDSTAIWYVQLLRNGEIRFIDYDEGSGESLQYWLGILLKKNYAYGKHIGPHDIMVHEYSTGMTRQAVGRQMGFNFIPAPKVDIIPGIDAVRNILPRCWFDEKKCEKGIKAIENYKKEWDDKHGCWRSQPLHNWASHGADAMRTLATGMHFISPQKAQINHNPHDYMQNRFNAGFR